MRQSGSVPPAAAGVPSLPSRPSGRDSPIEKLQTRIDWLAFKGEDTEDAFVDAPKRFLADESFQGFDT